MVSRHDQYIDFITDTDFDAISDKAWVTQASSTSRYTVENRLSGWSFGLGADISARLYDKTLEIKKSKKTNLYDLWRRAGWDGEATVWRLELQFRRSALASFRINTYDQLDVKIGDLWQTVTASWLRLTIPDATDTNRSRWPVHPLWERINGVLWRLDDSPLTRQYSPARVPSDDYLVRQYMSLVISFMAKYEIQDFAQGAAKFHEESKRIVAGRCQDKLEIRFEDWIAQQRAIKARQFNSRRNMPNPKQDASTSDEVGRDANKYDQSSNGE